MSLINLFKNTNNNYNILKKYFIYFYGHIGTGKTTCASIFAKYFISKGLNISKLSFASKLKEIAYKYFGIYKGIEQRNTFVPYLSLSDFIKKLNQAIEDLNLEINILLEKFEISKNHNESSKTLLASYLFDPELKKLNFNINLEKAEQLYKYYEKLDWRKFLQYLGTDIFRDEYDKDIWVKYLKLSMLNSINTVNVFLIDDVRFKNEREMIENIKNDIKKLENYNQYSIVPIGINIIANPEIVVKRINIPIEKYKENLKHIGEKEHKSFPTCNTINNNFKNIQQLENMIFKSKLD